MMGSGGDAARDKRKQKALRILQTDHAQVQPAAKNATQTLIHCATAHTRHHPHRLCRCGRRRMTRHCLFTSRMAWQSTRGKRGRRRTSPGARIKAVRTRATRFHRGRPVQGGLRVPFLFLSTHTHTCHSSVDQRVASVLHLASHRASPGDALRRGSRGSTENETCETRGTDIMEEMGSKVRCQYCQRSGASARWDDT